MRAIDRVPGAVLAPCSATRNATSSSRAR